MCAVLLIAAVLMFFLGGLFGSAFLAVGSVVVLFFAFLALVDTGSFTDWPR